MSSEQENTVDERPFFRYYPIVIFMIVGIVKKWVECCLLAIVPSVGSSLLRKGRPYILAFIGMGLCSDILSISCEMTFSVDDLLVSDADRLIRRTRRT